MFIMGHAVCSDSSAIIPARHHNQNNSWKLIAMRAWSSAALLCLLALLLPCARQIQAQTEHFGGAVNTLGSGFKLPYGVAVDSYGNVFVADTDNRAVREIVAVGGVVSSTSTVKTVGSGFKSPEGVVVDKKGNVFVADVGNNAVKEIVAVDGVVSSTSTVNTVGSGFKSPMGVAVDGRGNVFVGDTYNHAVKEIVAMDGVVSSTSRVETIGSGFRYPGEVAVDGRGNVFVAGSANSAVYEIMAVDGIVSSTSIVKTVGSGFTRPEGVAVDSSGNVYVSDWVYGTVKEIVAGTGGAASGTVSSTSTVIVIGSGFNKPESLAVDGSGNVFVADRDDSVVTKIMAEQRPSVTAPAAAAVDQLLVGNQELRKEQYADAEKFFADFLRKNPERMDAQLNLGYAEFGLKKYDEAEKAYKVIIDKYPPAWPAQKFLSEVYAAEGKWKDFDAVRKLLHDAKEKNEAGTYVIGNDEIDLLYVGDERYIVHEFYPLSGGSHIRYLFLHVDKQGKADYWITCESDDIDQISFAKMHSDLAAQGKRSFSLDSHSAPVRQPNGGMTQMQGLIKFYWEGEPTYETVRADVLGSLQHKIAPMATTTTNGAAPAPQQAPTPQK